LLCAAFTGAGLLERSHGWWLDLGQCLRIYVAWWAGVGAASSVGRRLAYRRGYRAGRTAIRCSLDEALARGFTYEQWQRAEIFRDLLDLEGSP
jgi:hypothetical protein